MSSSVSVVIYLLFYIYVFTYFVITGVHVLGAWLRLEDNLEDGIRE